MYVFNLKPGILEIMKTQQGITLIISVDPD
jgi:hypothetical protein